MPFTAFPDVCLPDLLASLRRCLDGLPGSPGAPVTHRAPRWLQRAHGAVLSLARRHRTRFALHRSQAERVTVLAGLGIADTVLLKAGGMILMAKRVNYDKVVGGCGPVR